MLDPYYQGMILLLPGIMIFVGLQIVGTWKAESDEDKTSRTIADAIVLFFLGAFFIGLVTHPVYVHA